MRKIIVSFVSLLLVFVMVFSTAITANAAVGDVTVTGSMQDTSDAANGVVHWAYTYNLSTGKASLRLWGNGYMPNGTEDDWFTAQFEAQCYIYSVTIEEGVKSIMSDAFAGEIYLKEVKLPSSIEFVGDGAFAYTAIESFNIPAKMNNVDANIFTGSSIKNFTVSAANPYYKSYNGNVYNKNMTELVMVAPYGNIDNFSFPETVTSIGRYAFLDCPITSVTIPSHIKSIKNMAFAGCSELQSVVIENGVEEIYDGAFLSCEALKHLQLPASVYYLGYCALGYVYTYDYDGLKDMLDYKGISYTTINELNFETYANLTGFGPDAFIICTPYNKFTLYAPVGSAGENYAKSFGMNYLKSSELLSGANSRYGVVLNWSFSHQVSYYNIYRKDGNSWVRIGYCAGEETSYTDYDAISNADNTYALEICYYSGYKYFDKSGINVHYVKTPDLKSITNAVGGVTVKWSAVEGSTRYYIYRRLPEDTSWTRLTYVSGKYTSYTDKTASSGQNYLYTVRAYDGVGVSAHVPDGPIVKYVGAPEYTLSNNAKGVAVKWGLVDKATSYRVYRKTASTGWQLLAEVDGAKKAYTDSTAKRGTTYYYTVRAVCDGIYSGYNTAGVAIKSLAVPTISVSNVGAGSKISWNKCAGASGYYVYRQNASGDWSRIAKITSGSTLSYTDKNVKSGQKYIYTVKAYSGSYYSTHDADGEATLFLTSPKVSSAQSTKSGVKVKYNTISGAKGYYIYRKTTNGSWVNVGNVKSGSTATFTDKTAKKGVTYIYTVRAYNGSYRSSYYSSGNKVKVVY